MASEKDDINHPSHYTWLNGFEAIDLCEQFDFCLGNALKYIIRSGYKGNWEKDLNKAIWYLQREIGRRKKIEENGGKG